MFTFIPEFCSRSPRNGVRNHPGIAFTFPRIPQANEPYGILAFVSSRIMSPTALPRNFSRATSRLPVVLRELYQEEEIPPNELAVVLLLTRFLNSLLYRVASAETLIFLPR